MSASIGHHRPAIGFDPCRFGRVLLDGVVQILQDPARAACLLEGIAGRPALPPPTFVPSPPTTTTSSGPFPGSGTSRPCRPPRAPLRRRLLRYAGGLAVGSGCRGPPPITVPLGAAPRAGDRTTAPGASGRGAAGWARGSAGPARRGTLALNPRPWNPRPAR
jgi:hypothetical protein